MPIGVIGHKSANQRQSYEPLSKRSSSAVDLKNSNGEGNLSKNWRTASTSDFRNELFSDGSDNLSTTSSKGNSRLLRDFSTEQIPTRLTSQQGPKLAYNPMQFVKTGPATKLSETAKNQLEKAKEIKQLREIKRDDGEEWQANLEGWKKNRLKRQENVIERVKDVKRMEEEEALRAAEEAANRTKMLRSLRENRGSQSRLLSLYTSEKDPEEEISDSSSSDDEQPDENPLTSRNSLKNSGLEKTVERSTELLAAKPNAYASESISEIQVRVQPAPKPVAAPRRSLNVSSETNTVLDADVESPGKTQKTQRYFEPLVQEKDFGTQLPRTNRISVSSTSVNIQIKEKEKVGDSEKGKNAKDENTSAESDLLENDESNESLAAEKIISQSVQATAAGRDTERKQSLTEASTNQVSCEEARTNEHLALEVPTNKLLASETSTNDLPLSEPPISEVSTNQVPFEGARINELLAPEVSANHLIASETLSNELLAPEVSANHLIASETLSNKLLHPKASANELSLSEAPANCNSLSVSSSSQNEHSKMIDVKTEPFDWLVGVSSPLAPPSEKPPPPPPITDNEEIPSPIKEIKLSAPIKQEVVYRDTDAVKSIRSELRKRRSDFLGFEVDSGHQQSTDQVVVPPPPDLKSLVLQTEVRPSELKMFADQPSDCSADKNPQRKSLDLLDLDYRKKEIIRNMEEEQTQHLESIRDSFEPKRLSLDKPRKFFSEPVYEEPRFEPRFEPKTQPVVPVHKDDSLEYNRNQEMREASQNRALPSVPGQNSSESTGPKEQARVVANQNSSPQMPEPVNNQYQTDPGQIGTSEAWKKTSLHEKNLPPSNLSQNGTRQISLPNAEQINPRLISLSSQDVSRHFNSQQSVQGPTVSHHQETRQPSPHQNRAVPSVPSHNQTAAHNHEPRQISADQKTYFIPSQNSSHNETAVHHKDVGQVSTDQKSYPVLSQNSSHQKDVGQISTDQNRALPSVPSQNSTHNQSAFHHHEPRQVSSDQNRALPSVPSQSSAYNQTAVHHKDVGQANLTHPERLSPQQVQLRTKTPYFVKPRPLSVMDLKDKSSRFDPNALLAKRKPEGEIQKRDVQRHWLVQEAELRRLTNQGSASNRSSAPPHWRSMPSVAAAAQSGAKKEERVTSDWTTQKIATPHTTSVIQPGTRKEERPPSDWTTQKMAPPKEIHHPRPAPQSLRGNFPKGASLPSNGMLSISGRKKCSVCSIELGHGAAMIIESLQLYFHVKCFRCCVCGTSLGNGTKGTDVRIRNCQLHCQSCYSTGALRVSQV